MLEFPIQSLQVGCDEVGRGCLFGPVYAGAVMFPPESELDLSDPLWESVKDSKKLSKKKHQIVSDFIKTKALSWGIGIATSYEIDRHNILWATHQAMHRALDDAYKIFPFESIAVDGTNFDPYMPHGRDQDYIQANCFPKGDANLIHIAAASIIAKHARDTWVLEQVEENPILLRYGLKTNMGYGSAAHMKALQQHGPHELHRMTFHPIKK